MATYVPMIRMKVNGVELQFMFSSMTNHTSISHSVAAQLGVPLKNLRPLPEDADLNECFYCHCPFQCFDAIYEFKGQKFESVCYVGEHTPSSMCIDHNHKNMIGIDLAYELNDEDGVSIFTKVCEAMRKLQGKKKE